MTLDTLLQKSCKRLMLHQPLKTLVAVSSSTHDYVTDTARRADPGQCCVLSCLLQRSLLLILLADLGQAPPYVTCHHHAWLIPEGVYGASACSLRGWPASREGTGHSCMMLSNCQGTSASTMLLRALSQGAEPLSLDLCASARTQVQHNDRCTRRQSPS